MIVDIKGTGQEVEFPDDMSREEIEAVLQKQFAPTAQNLQQNIDLSQKPVQGIQAVEPTLAEGMGDRLSNMLLSMGIITDPVRAHDVGQTLSGVLGVSPGIGDAQAGDEFGRAAHKGSIAGMGLASLGMIPIAGDALRKMDIGAILQKRFDDDWAGSVAEYAQLPGTDGGRIFNTDEWRELSPEYVLDRTRAAEVHSAASGANRRAYREALNQPVMEGREPIVRFMAGGAGAGKTSAVKTSEQLSTFKPDMTFDTTLSKGEGDFGKVEEALNSGRDAQIVHVYRDPVEAFENGVITRGRNKDNPNGRIVMLDAVVKNHLGARKSIEKFLEKYDDNPAVSFHLFDNSRGWDEQADASLGRFVDDVSELPPMDWTPESLKKEMKAVLDRKLDEGFIDKATYDRYLGK